MSTLARGLILQGLKKLGLAELCLFWKCWNDSRKRTRIQHSVALTILLPLKSTVWRSTKSSIDSVHSVLGCRVICVRYQPIGELDHGYHAKKDYFGKDNEIPVSNITCAW